MVDPILTNKQITKIRNYLRNTNVRDYMLFEIGIMTGLRVSDILELKVKDVKNKKEIRIYQKKTKRYKTIPIHRALRRDIKDYVKGMYDEQYLIYSTLPHCGNQPIKRNRAYRIIKRVCSKFDESGGLYNYGSHTMRKTFGHTLYELSGHDIYGVMTALDHTNPRSTLAYIGVERESLKNIISILKYN